MRTILSIAAAVFVFANAVHADIYQWEYIDPADPSQGKQQSTTLAPDGAGVDAVPGADLSSRNLTMAYLSGADLSNAYTWDTNLTNADLSQAKLTGVIFANGGIVTLTGADFTGADVRGAGFSAGGIGLTKEQLYSTASYQARDLARIALGGDLSGWNFVGQNLTNAGFGGTLTDADFTDAQVIGAGLSYTDLTPDQLYSTASYQARNLTGIDLSSNDLSGWNFAGQNLTNASFNIATLANADFSQANLTNANFGAADLTDADFTRAKIQGANFNAHPRCGPNCPTRVLTLAQLYSTASYQEGDIRGVSGLDLSNAITTNRILPNGYVVGLDLDAGGLLVVRDYPISITVDQHLMMDPGGTLRMVFEADAWDSTISFAPGIPVTLGGTLELTFAPDVNPASQLKRTFDLFDWTGVTPTGAFTIFSPYHWNLSNLYTTGEVTLMAIPEPMSLTLWLIFAAACIAANRVRPAQRCLSESPRIDTHCN